MTLAQMVTEYCCPGRHNDTQHNGTQDNDIQHNNTQQGDIQHNTK